MWVIMVFFSSKYSQKFIDHTKQSATDAFRSNSKRVIQKTEEGTGNLIGNKIADHITQVSKISLQNTLETVPSGTKIKGSDVKLPNERYISP